MESRRGLTEAAYNGGVGHGKALVVLAWWQRAQLCENEPLTRLDSKHRQGAGALNPDPGDGGDHATGNREAHDLLPAQPGVVTIGVARATQTLLGHEADKLRVPQRGAPDPGVIDLAETVSRSMKNRLDQGAQHDVRTC